MVHVLVVFVVHLPVIVEMVVPWVVVLYMMEVFYLIMEV